MMFSEKIQKLRKENCLSQEQLASKLNVSRQAISKWEMGTLPDMSNLVKISQFFDCSLDYLMNDEQEIVKNEKPLAEQKKNNCLFNLFSLVGIGLSIGVLIILEILSTIFPAPLTHQLDNGSFRIGLMGFIEYHGIETLLYIIFYIYIIGVLVYFILPLTNKSSFSKKYLYFSIGTCLFWISGWVYLFYELTTSAVVIYDFQSIALWVIYLICAFVLTFSLKRNGRIL